MVEKEAYKKEPDLCWGSQANKAWWDVGLTSLSLQQIWFVWRPLALSDKDFASITEPAKATVLAISSQ